MCFSVRGMETSVKKPVCVVCECSVGVCSMGSVLCVGVDSVVCGCV